MNLRVVKRIYGGRYAVGVELSDGSRYTDSQIVNFLKQGYKIKGLGYSGNSLTGAKNIKLSNLPKINLTCKSGISSKFKTVSGGISGAVARDNNQRMEEHAKSFYRAIVKRKDDVSKIAINTGFSVRQIQLVKDHLFKNKYDLGERDVDNNVVLEQFDPDFDQSVSWQNLIDGKNIREMDIILLKHELLEIKYMRQGCSYKEAHSKAEKIYNYKEQCDLLDKLYKGRV